MQITLNPADEQPSTLRAVALLLNSIASDRDGGKPATQVNVHVPNAAAGAETPPPPPPPLETANGANDTSTNGTNNSANTSNASGELDKNGLPWDERIHSSSKNTNADGTWRYLRVSNAADKPAFEELKQAVEAELRATLGGDRQQPPPPPPPPLNQGAETPPPPPPMENKPADTGGAPVEMKEVFSRAAKLPKDLQTMALDAVGLCSMAEFLKAVKERPEVAAELLQAVIAVEGDD